MDNVLEMSGVVKRFGSFAALDGLDLTVARGEVPRFLGAEWIWQNHHPSTRFRDASQQRWIDARPWLRPMARRRESPPPFGLRAGDVSLWPNLTGGQVIDLLGRLQGGQDGLDAMPSFEIFDLDPTKKARSYSKGNRQKVALIAALATDAEFFLLDEPTSGLDPLKEEAFRECVRQLRDDGRTVLLSSHILSEAEALSDRVSIIRDGKVVESGRLTALRHLTRTSITADVTTVPGGLDRIPGCTTLLSRGTELAFRLNPSAWRLSWRPSRLPGWNR